MRGKTAEEFLSRKGGAPWLAKARKTAVAFPKALADQRASNLNGLVLKVI